MDRIYAIKSLREAEDFFMDRGLSRVDAIRVVEKIRKAVVTDWTAKLSSLLAKPNLLY